jgi:hypothetical protein
MNDRIRELIREAGFYSNSDVEKFDALIQSVIEMCSERAQDYVNRRTWDSAAAQGCRDALLALGRKKP